MQFTAYIYLIDFGVRDSVIRYTSKFNAKKSAQKLNEIITSSLVLYSIIALIGLVIVVIAAFLFPYIFDIKPEMSSEVSVVVFITGLTIAQTFVFNVFNGVLVGLQRSYMLLVFNAILIVIRVGLIVYFLEAGYKIVALASIQLFIGFVLGLITIVISLNVLKNLGYSFRFYIRGPKYFRVTISRLINYSKYVFVINIATKIVFATDAIVIGIFMNVASVTFYAIAGNLIDYLKQLMITSSSVFNPVTSHLEALGKKESIQDVLRNGSRFNLFIGLPIAVTYIVLGQEFIGLWMGAEYAQLSGYVLMILAATQLLSFQQYTISSVLFGVSMHKYIAYWRVIEAVLNLGLSIILIQYMGVVGVAIGTAVPHILVSVIVFPLLAKKVSDLPLRHYFIESIGRPMLAIVPFALLAITIKETIAINSLFSFFFYVAILLVVYFGISMYIVVLPKERAAILQYLRHKLPGFKK